MILIAAVDRAWAIGKGGRLLVKIPRDQRLFLRETLGKTVIMGRKTFLDLPGQQPLYGRHNIVLSRNLSFKPKGVTVCRNIEEVLQKVRTLPRDQVFVCGGESIYRDFLPYADCAEITKIDYLYDGDRFFPNLDKKSDWLLTQESEEETYFDLPFSFCRYERRCADGRTYRSMT